MTDTPSSLAAAADAVLRTKGYNLRDWLADQVESGVGTRLIAARLINETDGIVAPTHETIRRWIAWYESEAAA